MNEKIEGKVWKFGDNIDTDVIIPGRYLRTFSLDDLAAHVMEGVNPDFSSNVKKGDIIVADWNFGCGSSREQAPVAIKHAGVSAIVAKSFARIFYRNSVDGAHLLPIEIDRAAYESIGDKDQLEIEINKQQVKNVTKNKTYSMRPFPELIKKIIDAGGLLNYTP